MNKIMEIPIEDICQMLDTLVCTKKKDGSQSSSTSISSVLQERIGKLMSHVESNKKMNDYVVSRLPRLLDSDYIDVYWRFVEWCLFLLVILKQSLRDASKKLKQTAQPKKTPPLPSDAPPLSQDTLSVQQQKTVSSSTEFIVGLGIWPCLIPSVRHLVKDRSKYSDALLDDRQMSYWKLHRQHVACIVALLTITKHSLLGSLILSHHLGDILASLCQICHAPIKKKVEDPIKPISDDSSSSVSHAHCSNSTFENLSDITDYFNRVYDPEGSESDLIDEMWNDRSSLTHELNWLVDRVYQPLVIRELLMLQGAPISKVKNASTSHVSAPSWLKKICGQLLTERLMKPGGVLAIMQGILQLSPDLSVESQGSSIANTDWMKCDSLAKLIALAPSTCTTEEYYKNISSQVYSLLTTKNEGSASIQYRIVSCIIFYMLEYQPHLAHKYILSLLLKPLQNCITDFSMSETDPEDCIEITNEADLSLCIEQLHKILICGSVPSTRFLNELLPVVHPLYLLGLDCQDKVSYLREYVEDILAIVLKHSDIDAAVSIVHFLLFGSPPHIEKMCRTSKYLTFTLGDGGGMKAIVEWRNSSPGEWLKENEKIMKFIVEVLQRIENKKFVGALFLSLLQKLTSILTDGNKETREKSESVGSNSSLLYAEHARQVQEETLSNNLLLLSLLQHLIDSYDEGLLEDQPQAVQFVKATLERGAQLHHSCEKEEEKELEIETLMMAMSAIAMLLESKDKLKSSDWIVLKSCLPSLDQLSTDHPDSLVQSMAQELRTVIKTHGIAGECSLKTQQSSKPEKNIVANESPDYEKGKGSKTKQHAATLLPDEQRAPSKDDVVKGKEPGKQSAFQEAIKELKHPLLPVKGHALITLKTLILSRDSEALQNKEKLLKVFQEQLSDTDSYIYLAAIQGLAVLGDVNCDDVLPLLASEFSKQSADAGGHATEVRLKLGEAIIKCTQNLGDMAAKYRDLLLNAFLCGTKDKNPLLRASSLSNLGEICKHLKFSLGLHVQEVLCCLQCFIQTDPSKEARRAAIMVLVDIFRGTGKDSLKVLETEMLDIYRLLKRVYRNDDDDVMKLHAQLALEEIRDIMFTIIQTKPNMVKEIRILDPL